jgi:predicted DNA repair protein MutK
MVKGAVRTDFILSAEIMVIALNEVLDEHLAMRAATLAIVAIAITIAVYGVVGLIVKMDDIGLHMARNGGAARRAIGRGLVTLMPRLLAALATIGTAAMLWVGGQIVLHGLDEYGLGAIGHALHDGAHAVAGGLPAAGVWEWLINAAGAGLFGVLLGSAIAGVLHVVPGKRAEH